MCSSDLVVGDINALYDTLGKKLKRVFKRSTAWVICPDDKDLIGNIGLKPSINYPLLNGELECVLRQYVSFDGKFNDMRRRGENIRNREFRASERSSRFAGEKHQRRDDFKGARDRRPRRDDDDRRPRRPRRDEFHGPLLGKDAEVPIIKGVRRKGWKRKDLDTPDATNEA